MFDAHACHSLAQNLPAAVTEMLQQAQDHFKNRTPKAGILLTSLMDADFDACLAMILERYPSMRLVGCTTDGELSSVHGYHSRSSTLTLLDADAVSFASGLGRGLAEDPQGAVRDAVEQVRSELGAEPAACIVLPDAFAAFGRSVDAHLRALLPGTAIAGGSAADDYRISRTFQFHGGESCYGSVALLALRGEVDVAVATGNGFESIGPVHEVTGSQGPLLQEVDGVPVLDFYAGYIGREVTGIADINQFSIAVQHGEDFVVQAPAAVVPEAAGVVMASPLPPGSTFRMTQFDTSDLLDAARDCAARLTASYPGTAPGAVLAFSCTSRRLILGTRAGEELERVRRALPPDTTLSGFFTYGEFGPLVSGGSDCRFHNGSIVLMALG